MTLNQQLEYSRVSLINKGYLPHRDFSTVDGRVETWSNGHDLYVMVIRFDDLNRITGFETIARPKL